MRRILAAVALTFLMLVPASRAYAYTACPSPTIVFSGVNYTGSMQYFWGQNFWSNPWFVVRSFASGACMIYLSSGQWGAGAVWTIYPDYFQPRSPLIRSVYVTTQQPILVSPVG